MAQVSQLYEKLPSRQPWIRLLKIRPATDPSDGIDCELSAFPLEHAPPYKALSYAWNESQGVERSFTHQSFPREGRLEIANPPPSKSWSSVAVSPSLTLAIRRQRRKERNLFLWIDAVCINQADDDERTEQVALMGSIYQRAVEVVIWLGERRQEDELGEWLQGTYSRAVQHLDWSSHQTAKACVSRYINEYCILRDGYHGPICQKTDVFGAFCLIWLLAQGRKPSDIVFYHSDSYVALSTSRFRTEWAAQVTQGLRSIMTRNWVCCNIYVC